MNLSKQILQLRNLTPTVPSLASLDKTQKCGAKEFRGKVDDDLAKFEYWLLNMKIVFIEYICTPEDYLSVLCRC
ncbi:Zinc finger CCHC domain-containing 8 [Gossypium australe]|uniref:Zinc finger CCHC domain-containing 8 n=1 Tax=Gossypium australe TaxID=47621 RepID=A0A5B6UVL6_9ROSI|nr:Zinc finger CCHC domain-containing 8 [Gossypium australe]